MWRSGPPAATLCPGGCNGPRQADKTRPQRSALLGHGPLIPLTLPPLPNNQKEVRFRTRKTPQPVPGRTNVPSDKLLALEPLKTDTLPSHTSVFPGRALGHQALDFCGKKHGGQSAQVPPSSAQRSAPHPSSKSRGQPWPPGGPSHSLLPLLSNQQPVTQANMGNWMGSPEVPEARGPENL